MGWLRTILGFVFGPHPVPVPTPPPSGDARARLLAAVNAVRGRVLLNHPGLAGTAQAWAEDMARRGVLEHGDFAGRIRAGYPGAVVGEDIAAGQATPEEAVADWMRDPPHRRSVTDPTFRYAGCGVAALGGRTYWVIDLGG